MKKDIPGSGINPEKQVEDKSEKQKDLVVILYNDDVNTFDHVIKCLIKYCKHEPEQAEQCSYIVHHKGKCEIKRGPIERLVSIKNVLTRKGLSVEIV
ncbi:MAG: ATP-dependent Clp protease adaptor protein ClpS [Flavobacteriales bacterium]|jgi:ATP-dependent Clp protease adaptor protein ClpS